MTIPSFSIDTNMLENFSVEDINSKNDQLGFYKTNNHTYVITTRNNTTHPNFTSQIGQILALFKEAQFSIDEALDAQNSFKFAQYLDCVYNIVDRYNMNINSHKEKDLVKFLLQIPLISSVVEWIFDQLLFSFPDAAYEVFNNSQQNIIQNYYESAKNLEALALYRQTLLNNLKDAKKKPSRGQGCPEVFWEQQRRIINKQFEQEIFNRSAALQIAQNIIDEKEPALNFGLEIDPIEGPTLCTRRLNSLTLPLDFANLASAGQTNLINTARDAVLKAWGQWHIERIKLVCNNAAKVNREPLLTDLIVSIDPNEFTKKFFSLVSRISPLSARDEIAMLEKQFAAYRKGLITKRLGESDSLQMLQICKDALLKDLEKTAKEQNPQHGQDYQARFWKNEQLAIQKVFEEELDKRVPTIQKIHNILATSESNVILGFGADIDPYKAAELCNIQIKSLVLSQEIILLDGSRLNGIFQKARQKIVDAYGNWNADRICLICEKFPNPSIEDLLISKDPNKFKERYTSISKRLTDVKRTDAIELIHKHYEAHLFNIFNTLRESLKTPKKRKFLFQDIYDIEVLKAKYQEKIAILDEWYTFKKKVHADLTIGDIEDLKIMLKEAYEFNLIQTVPVFGIALDILGERETELLLLTSGSSSSSPSNQSEKWIQNNLDLIRFELSKPYTEHLSPEAINKMKEAEKRLLEELSKLKEKQIQELLTKKEKSKSIFDMASDLFPSFITNIFIDYSELPLQTYRDMLLKVLQIKKETLIEQTYEAKMKEISALPNSDAMKSKIIDIYECYKRAEKIQPLIRIINPGSLLPGNISLQKLTKENNLVDIIDIENYVNNLLELIDLELEIQKFQTNNVVAKALEQIKTQLKDQLEKKLVNLYPSYLEIKNICQKFENPCLNMHKSLINVPISELNYKNSYFQGSGNSLYKVATSKYDKMINICTELEGSNPPPSIKGDCLKAKGLLVLAYKEWEAEHILNADKMFESESDRYYWFSQEEIENRRSAAVLGLPYETLRTEKSKRYRTLSIFLHPDKNGGITKELADKFQEASKLLGNPP